MAAKILIVEDDIDIQSLIRITLSNKQLGDLYTANDINEAKVMYLMSCYWI